MDQSVLAGRVVGEPKELGDVLEHFGIKGMKWGVRRANPSAAPPRSSDSASVQATKAKIKSGGTKSLSNQELKDLMERVDLEKRYNKAHPTAKQQTLDFVKKTITDIGKQEITKLAAKQLVSTITRRRQ
jgi:hypothetical protein